MTRPRRRIRTEPVPGADPTPQRFERADGTREIVAVPAGEDRLEAWGGREVILDEDAPAVHADSASSANDEDLRDNVPPHHG